MAAYDQAVVSAGSILPGGPYALEAQARIDHRVAELQQTIYCIQTQIIALHTQRNTLSVISRLPSELLSAVFVHCARMHYEAIVQADLTDEKLAADSESTRVQTHGAPQLTNVSYVCRHWRDVALNCPPLWSYIFPTSQRWVEEFLSRSRQAPLRIHLEWKMGQPEQICLLERVLHHTERIQELELGIPSVDYERVSSLFSSPAPLLQSLTVAVDIDFRMPSRRGWSLFDGDASALRRLELSWCPIPRLPSMLNSLTTCILHRSFRGTIAELTASLRLMPNLVHLELHFTIYTIHRGSDTRSGDDAEELRLPHLQRLIIYENMSNVVGLLPLLIVSPRTEVKIRTCREDTEWMAFRSLLIKRFFASRDTLPPSILTLVIVDSMTSISFSKSKLTGSDIQPPDGRRNIPLQIVFDDDFGGDGVSNTVQYVVQDAYCSGYLASLQSAGVTINPQGELGCGTFLEDTLGSIPELRSVCLTGVGEMLGCLCSFLSFTPHPRMTERDGNTSFGFAPSLEELVVDQAIFDRRSDFSEQSPQSHIASLSHLYDSLAIRKENGYAIKRLTLSKCRNLFKEDMAELRGLVSDVVWDEDEVDVQTVDNEA